MNLWKLLLMISMMGLLLGAGMCDDGEDDDDDYGSDTFINNQLDSIHKKIV